jgi:hypothetical protein
MLAAGQDDYLPLLRLYYATGIDPLLNRPYYHRRYSADDGGHRASSLLQAAYYNVVAQAMSSLAVHRKSAGAP